MFIAVEEHSEESQEVLRDPCSSKHPMSAATAHGGQESRARLDSK